MNQRISYVTALLIAALSTGAFASVVQTQVSLAELSGLGLSISWSDRAFVTLEDLARFGPVMAGIGFVSFLPAILLASILAKQMTPVSRALVYSLLAAASLWFVLWLTRSVIPMPAIAATRMDAGHALMALTGVPGGAVLSALTSKVPTRAGTSLRYRVVVPVALFACPVLLFLAMAPRAAEPIGHVDPASYRIETVASDLNRPWSIAFLPDNRILVTEMGGRLLAISPDGSSSQISLDGLPPIFVQGGVSGLMDVAIDPHFGENSFIYLTMGYGESAANGTRLVRGRLVGEKVEDVRILFSSTPKPRAGNNGGRIAFLDDETLILSLGDGSARREEAQNIENHLGTLVRVDRDGRPPADNPFFDRPNAAPEVYSIGHRNVQGLAFDRGSGNLLISEHGARGGDELNNIVAGGNYGWPVVTGGIDYPFARVSPFRSLDGYQDALLEWTPSIAPAGLAIHSGPLFSQWNGDLLVPALKERTIRRVIRLNGEIVGQQLLLAELDDRMRDVKVAPDGSIYVATDGAAGKLLRITPASLTR